MTDRTRPTPTPPTSSPRTPCPHGFVFEQCSACIVERSNENPRVPRVVLPPVIQDARVTSITVAGRSVFTAPSMNGPLPADFAPERLTRGALLKIDIEARPGAGTFTLESVRTLAELHEHLDVTPAAAVPYTHSMVAYLTADASEEGDVTTYPSEAAARASFEAARAAGFACLLVYQARRDVDGEIEVFGPPVCQHSTESAPAASYAPLPTRAEWNAAGLSAFKPGQLYYCASPACKGRPWRASALAHPLNCGMPQFPLPRDAINMTVRAREDFRVKGEPGGSVLLVEVVSCDLHTDAGPCVEGLLFVHLCPDRSLKVLMLAPDDRPAALATRGEALNRARAGIYYTGHRPSVRFDCAIEVVPPPVTIGRMESSGNGEVGDVIASRGGGGRTFGDRPRASSNEPGLMLAIALLAEARHA